MNKKTIITSMAVLQLFTGIIIDGLSTGKISIYQVVGGLLVVIGLSYNLYIDKI